MRVSKEIQIGIRAVKKLSTMTEPVSAASLAEQIETTAGFLSHILAALRHDKIVLVKRGPGGGYSLNFDMLPISAFDVARALDSDFATMESRKHPDPAERVNGEIIDAFLRTTICEK